MGNHTFSRRGHALAAVGAIALIAASTLGAGAANAATSFGNIDEDANGSIIIHKHEFQSANPAVPASPDGSESISSPAVADVEFTAYQLLRGGAAVDLADPAAWDDLSDLSVGAACDGTVTGAAGYSFATTALDTVTTDADGVATLFDGTASDVGAYVVCETDAPSTVVQRAVPFVVTIPTPFEDGWLYDVNVYPKNGVGSIEKTITEQDDKGLGSVAQFPVTSKIPTTGGESFTGFVVADTFDARLTPTAAADGVGAGVKSVSLSARGTQTPVDPALYSVVADGQTSRVVFNDDGLDWLETQQANSVVVLFQATVTSLGDNGSIPNTAVLYVNEPNVDSDTTPTEVTPPVTTNWGDIKALKVDAADPSTGLAGAEFEVYEAATPYPTDGVCTNAKSGDAIIVNGASTFTTASTGVLTIAGLFVSDSTNAPVSAAERCYVLVETKAPAGFVTPIGDAASTPVAVTTGNTNTTVAYDATIENGQQNVPNLPLTGASGQLIMVSAGVGFVALALGFMILARRKARRAQG